MEDRRFPQHACSTAAAIEDKVLDVQERVYSGWAMPYRTRRLDAHLGPAEGLQRGPPRKPLAGG